MVSAGRLRPRPLLLVAIALGLLAILPAAPGGALVRTGAGPWVWENPLPQGNTLNDAAFTSATTGWAVGDTGTLQKTTDGGVTWTLRSLGTSASLKAVLFVDAQHGWIGGYAGTMLRTTDGGATWTAQDVGGMDVNDIAVAGTGAWDAVAIVAVGLNGAIRRTSNGGTTWTPQTTPGGSEQLLAVSFFDANNGWAVGDSRALLHTTNGGGLWTAQTYSGGLAGDGLLSVAAWSATKAWIGMRSGRFLSTSNGGTGWTMYTSPVTWVAVNDLVFVSATVGYAAIGGDDGWREYAQIWTTTDGGATWLTGPDPSPPFSTTGFALNALSLRSPSIPYSACAVGTTGAVLTSPDMTSWTRQTSGMGHTLSDISMSSASHGWAVGYEHTILRTTDGLTWVEQPIAMGVRIDAVVALSDTEAYAGGTEFQTGKSIIHTSDGGQTWVAQSTPGMVGGKEVWDLTFVNAAIGWAACTSGEVFTTVNGGTDWVRHATTVAGALYGIDATAADRAWVVGPAGVLRRTIDTGSTWIQQTVPSGYESTDWQDIDMVTGQMGWVVGSGGKILKTIDGTSWTAQVSPPGTNALHSVHFVSATEGWACGTGGVVIHTVNGGADWTTEDLGTTEILNGIAPLASGAVWAAGRHGAILVRDLVAPVTTDGIPADGWIASRAVTFTPSDAVSGVASTNFKIDGSPWLTGTWLPPMAEGTHALSYFSTDNAGNHETQVDRTIRVDATAPTASNDLPARSGWMKPRTVTLTGTDALSGVGGVYYSVDGGAPSGGAGASCAVPAPPDGVHTIACWAVDNVGNSGEASPAGYTVRFDGKRPTPKALAAATVKKGKKVTLRYRVNDAVPGCGKANVTITIKTLKGKQVKKLPVIKNCIENKKLTCSFVCKIKAGKYRFWVSATDVAGNKASKKASAKLTVK